MSAGERAAARIGGGALVVGSLGFVAVFAYLASTFRYPDVLDRPAHDVLPALAAGGATLRAAWLLYGAIPLTLLVGGIAAMPLLERGAGRTLARLGAAFAAVAAMSMVIGLLRWPSIQWALAERWASASGEQREVLATLFDAANTYLGNILGEYLGEVMLAAWFGTIGIAAWRLEHRRFGRASIAMSLLLLISAQRQLSHLADPVAEVNNLLLPAWLIAVGVFVWRDLRQEAPRPERPWASAPSTA